MADKKAAVEEDNRTNHRIKDDRMENSLKGRRIWHCAFAASIFKVQRLRQYSIKLGGLFLPTPPPLCPALPSATHPPLPSAKTFFIVARLCYFEMKTNKETYFSILSSIILWPHHTHDKDNNKLIIGLVLWYGTF